MLVLHSICSMTDHPITPPPELVRQWFDDTDGILDEFAQAFATEAARWGADQELEACVEHLKRIWSPSDTIDSLYTARRPSPPSLKEQALDAWDRLRNEAWCEEIDYDLDFVRRALEALPND